MRWLASKSMGKKLFERKDHEDKPKDYLIGLDGKLQVGLRKKCGLAPSIEGHSHGG